MIRSPLIGAGVLAEGFAVNCHGFFLETGP
jgi:hypothetical protein